MKPLVALLAMALTEGQAIAGSPAFNRPPRVADSAGKVIGSADLGPSLTPVVVLRRVGGAVVSFYLASPFLLLGTSSLALVHETSDCSGTRYVVQDATLLLRGVDFFDPSTDGTGPFQ